MGLPDRVPGMTPGRTRRNAVVGLLYLLGALLAAGVAATGTGDPATGGGTVGIGVSTPNDTPTPASTTIAAVPIATPGVVA